MGYLSLSGGLAVLLAAVLGVWRLLADSGEIVTLLSGGQSSSLSAGLVLEWALSLAVTVLCVFTIIRQAYYFVYYCLLRGADRAIDAIDRAQRARGPKGPRKSSVPFHTSNGNRGPSGETRNGR